MAACMEATTMDASPAAKRERTLSRVCSYSVETPSTCR